MRGALTCPQCRTRSFWLVDSQPRLEALICRGCGLTAWYARAPHDDEALQSIGLRCADCDGARGLRIDPFVARDEEGNGRILRVFQKGFPKYWGEGRFALDVCRDCGLTRWRAHGMRTVERSAYYGFVEAFDAPKCGACRVRRMRIERAALPVTREERGYFELLLCRSCGDTEWYGRALDELRPSRDGVALVEAPPTPLHMGPYR